MTKLVKETKSKQYAVGALIIVAILILTAIPMTMFTNFSFIVPVQAEILDDYETGWDHHIQFIIDHDFIDEELTAFPVLVVIPTAVGSQANDGNSIRFLNYNLTEVYYHEIELWNGAGDSYVWVRVNDTSSTEDTRVVMFYGNATAPDTQSNLTWDSHYIAVYHMNSPDSTTVEWDSTEIRVGLKREVAKPYDVAGIIGRANEFNDVGGIYANITATPPQTSTDDVTVEFWFDTKTTGVSQYLVENSQWSAATALAWSVIMLNPNTITWTGTNAGSASMFGIDTGVDYTSNIYIACTTELEVSAKIYINTSLIVEDDSITGNWQTGGDQVLRMGCRRKGIDPFDDQDPANGTMDEVRISNIARSAAWLKASYHSGNQTTGFFTWKEIDSGLVYTNATTNIDTTSATLNGRLQLNGSKQTWYGFRYGKTSDALSTNYTVGTDGADNTPFSYDATGLNDGSVYYVQAWANNSGGFSTGVTESFWTNSTWTNLSLTYRRRITIDKDFIDEDLYNFPILVIINSTVGQYCDGGNSTRFYKNNTVQYYYEIDTWNSTENSSVWVNVTHVYKDVDTVFYMYYGNSEASDSQNPTDVWDINYLAVWHMNGLLDSTINDIDLTNDGAIGGIDGQIGLCYDFEFDDIDCLYHNTFLDDGFDVLSMECWANHESNLNGNYISKRNILSEDRLYFRRDAGSLSLFVEATNSGTKTASGGVIADDTWVYTFGSYSKGSELRVFLNTVESLGNIQSNSFRSGTTDHFLIGKLNSVASTNAMDGLIDEVRISDIVRSDSWVTASYHSQKQTVGFMTFGSEQTRINNPPTQSGEAPVNSSTGISITPSLHVICTDADSDIMTATWRSNSSGDWIDFATNTTISTGTNITQTNSNFSAYGTTYWWSVNLTDGTDWINETYHFTTNVLPTLSGESPTNSSTGVSLTPSLYVVCTDADSDIMAATWRSNSSGAWVDFATNTSISTGTNITQPNSNFSAYSTTYYWSVNLTDGIGWCNETYHFTTAANNPSVFSGEVPANESTNVTRITAAINVTIEDPDGDTFNWTIETSPDVGSDLANDESNGSKSCSVSGLVSGTTYTWYVNCTDGTDWTNETYHFTTSYAPTQSGEVPVNGSVDQGQTPICNVTASDQDGSDLTVYFYENTTGSWVLQQTNSSHTANTSAVWDNYANASAYSTTYWWSVNLTDGIDWCNETYHFTTVANNPSVFSGEVPANESTNVTRITAAINVTIEDPDGDTFNWTIETSPDVGSDLANDESNGSKSCSVSGLVSGTTYTWYVNCTDGTDWTNETYHFTTSYAPVLSNPGPANGSIDQSRTPICNVTASDQDGGTLTVYFYENTTGGWVLQQTNSSHPANTSAVWDNYTNASVYSTKYWWKVNVSDGKGCYDEEIYHFTIINDLLPPIITSESITSGLTSGENATIRANVTDESNIDASWITVNDTDGVLTNYTMSQEGLTDFYNVSFEIGKIGTWHYKVFANDSNGNLNNTASWHSFIVSKPDATPNNEVYSTSASPLTLIRITAELDATDLLKSVNATLNIPSGFSFTNTDIYPQNQGVGNFSAFETKTAEWHVFTPIIESIYTFNITWVDTYENTWDSGDKNIEVSYDITNLSNSTFVNVICAVEMEAGNDFTAEIMIRNGLGNYVNADSTPEISLIDPLGDVSVGPTTAGVVNIGTGRYSYTKSTAASWMGGSWQIFADVTRNGYSFTDREFFKITSGPFDVRDISIIDNVVSTLIISVVLENQGGATKDMYVEWELTRVDTNGLLDSGSDTVAVAGSSTLTHIVFPFTSYVGDVKITFVGWYGVDFTERAGAFETFTTVSEEVPPSGGPSGVIPGVPSTYTLTIICEDISGNTISGVLLQISGEGNGLGSKYTDIYGEAFFEIPKHTTITISASKTGYESVEQTIMVDNEMTITLYMSASAVEISVMLWLLLIIAISIIVFCIAYKKYNNKKR